MPVETEDYVLELRGLKSEVEQSGMRVFYVVRNKLTNVVEGVATDLPGGISGLYAMQEALDGARRSVQEMLEEQAAQAPSGRAN